MPPGNTDEGIRAAERLRETHPAERIARVPASRSAGCPARCRGPLTCHCGSATRSAARR
jgi:hypothetical protein